MATLIIKSGSTLGPPIRLRIDLNGVTYSLEYPNKQAALDDIISAPDADDLPAALRLVLKEWKKTDPQFNNLAGLVNKTCTITFSVSIV
jgi:hypothetical protein